MPVATPRFIEQGKWKAFVLPVLFLATVITCWQQVNEGNFNNINIFRHSSMHLLAHRPLYIEYPAEYFDFYLYHPAFAVLFLPFAYLPTVIALFAWLIFSVAVFARAVQRLPGLTDTAKKIVLLLTVPELINNLQFVQTNIFLVAVMLFVFINLENQRLWLAAFCAVLAFCMKGYGGITGLLFLFYPGRLKFLGWCAVWMAIITCLPLLFVSFSETVEYYRTWIQMISSDEIKEGESVIGAWGKTHMRELLLTGLGLALLLLALIPTIARKRLRESLAARAIVCCYLLVWVVLFNRAAESPTYLIAAPGLAAWLAYERFNKWALFITIVILTLAYLGPSDLFPAIIHSWFRHHHIKKYLFMAFLLVLQVQLLWPKTIAGNPRPTLISEV